MLSIGLTGGIAAGKSLLSARFRELGAVVVDADRLARDVVAPGTPGIAAVAATFGPGVLAADGSLDRAALGAVAFADRDKLAALNAIVHPLVRAAAARLTDDAAPGSIVVQDIPLLVETGQPADFHLVVVVDAPAGQRLARMVELRGMTPEEARARMAAQAGDGQRKAAADVVLDNSGAPEAALAALDALWGERLVPFARNLAAGVPAAQAGPAALTGPDPAWPGEAARLAARIAKAAGGAAVAVDHIGSTSVPGLAARNAIDLQLRVRSLADADAAAPALAAAGFPRREGRCHNAADPARPVNLHVRVDGSPAAGLALAFRDWLRADDAARRRYESVKRELAAAHAGDATAAGYAEAKDAWFASALPGLVRRLAETTTSQPE